MVTCVVCMFFSFSLHAMLEFMMKLSFVLLIEICCCFLYYFVYFYLINLLFLALMCRCAMSIFSLMDTGAQ
jgi:hypothetical protein